MSLRIAVSFAYIVVLTDVVFHLARTTLGMLLRLSAYPDIQYTNTIEYSTRVDHACHQELLKSPKLYANSCGRTVLGIVESVIDNLIAQIAREGVAPPLRCGVAALSQSSSRAIDGDLARPWLPVLLHQSGDVRYVSMRRVVIGTLTLATLAVQRQDMIQ
jgi:hypothetical protein